MAERQISDPEKAASGDTDKTRLVREQAAPPSYESLYGRVKSAKSESASFLSFLRATFYIMIGTVCCTISSVLFMAIPIAMIAIGAYYLHDCPAERYIPIYLVVAGCFAYLRMFLSVGSRVRTACCPRESDDERDEKANSFYALLDCFQIAWFIAGNVWIYRTYGKFNESEPDAANYCNPTLYYFAFWLTTSVYILLVAGFFTICCFGIFAKIKL